VYGQLCDVSKQDQVDALIAAAEDKLGGIDVLINNAGLGTSQTVVEMADDEWHKVIDVTLTGTFRMTRAALRVMQPRGRGVIVNNASVLGWRAQTEQAHYAAAKAGVMALTRCAAVEAAEFGVRINAVAPSIAIHAFLKKSASEELLDELARQARPSAAAPSPGKWPT
jgi:3-oxoacyl-[acyl-carrier protein] reductase